MKKILDRILGFEDSKSLSDIDKLYREAISGLSVKTRIDYCLRLIDRLNYETQNSYSPEEQEFSKRVILAAEKELKKLRKMRD